LANLVLLELLEPMDKLVLLELKEKQVPKEKMVWMHSRDLPAKKDLLANLDFEDLLAKKEPLANLVCPDTTESQETRHPLAWRDNKDPLALMVNKDVWVSKDPLVKPARKAGKEKRDLKDHKEEMERMESLENEEKKGRAGKACFCDSKTGFRTLPVEDCATLDDVLCPLAFKNKDKPMPCAHSDYGCTASGECSDYSDFSSCPEQKNDYKY